MFQETVCERGATLVRRLILEPGEATPWHVDPYHRVTVVVRGSALAIEYREGGGASRIEVRPGMSDWDEPGDKVHRAVNVGDDTYEEVATFFLDRPGDTPQPRRDARMTAIDSSALPWEERPNERIGRSLYRKNLIVDPDTGMEVRLVRYPAGAVNPLHTHPCAHGMYVLEGTLVTHDGRYGPGHFVWFPEGCAMEHGATAEQDVTVLFITNKPFEIQYR